MRRPTAYGLAVVGLIVGLGVLLGGPLPTGTMNVLVGGGLLAAAVISITSLIIDFSGPDERGPDF